MDKGGSLPGKCGLELNPEDKHGVRVAEIGADLPSAARTKAFIESVLI